MRIFKTDDKITVAAKKAAMICEYAIRNPLHATFEDGNYNYDTPMDHERKWNEKHREKNGERMYQFIEQFLNEFDELTREERKEAYRLFRKKWAYLDQRWMKKIRENSKRPALGEGGMIWHHYLAADGHICVKTDLGIEFVQF